MGIMKKLLLSAALALGLANSALAQFCPSCIQNSGVPQNAQMNIGTATVRGVLTAGSLSISSITVATITASAISGNGAGITALNASQLQSGTVPSARVTGSYPNITGVGTVAAGTWQGGVIGSPYGGTGANLGTANPGSIPYFSSVGTMGVITPGLPGQLLQANGAGAEVWTSSPQVSGINLFNIPQLAIASGTWPPGYNVNDYSISTVSASKVIGNISGNAANITGTLAIGQLGFGILPNGIPASSITVTGVTPGIYGVTGFIPDITVGSDGRITAASQVAFAVSPSSLTPGPLPPYVTVPPGNITAGSLANNVIASSLNVTGVTPGVYGNGQYTPQITVQGDGRLSTASMVPIVVSPSSISAGNLPLNVGVPAQNVLTGSLGLGVLASSFPVTGVTAGTYGGGAGSLVSQFTVTPDGRITSATQFEIPGVSTFTPLVNVQNVWTAPQLFLATVTVTAQDANGYSLKLSSGISMSSGTVQAAQFNGKGPLLTNLTPANFNAGSLPSNVIASSIAVSGVVPGSYGGANQTLTAAVQGDGRLSALSAQSIAINTNQINAGTLPSNVIASSVGVQVINNPNQIVAGTIIGSNLANNTLTNTQMQSGTFSNIFIPAPNVNAGSLGSSVIASSLAVNGVTPGTCGTASAVCTPTIASDGRITSQSNTSIVIAQSQVTGLVSALATKASTGTNNDITTLSALSTIIGPVAINNTLTMNSSVNMNGNLISNGANPVSPQDLATKYYTDMAINGLSWKAPGRLGTTTTLPVNSYSNGSSGVGATLTATSIGTLSVDGAVANVGDRVLVQNEAATAHNGVYQVTQNSALVDYILTRTTDYNTASEMAAGSAIFISSGLVNSDMGFVQTSTVGVVGTDAVVFVQFTGVGQITVSNSLIKTGNNLSVNSSSVAVLGVTGYVLSSNLDPAVVTKQGNIFNGASQLVQLDVNASEQLTGSITATTGTFVGNAFSVGGSTLVVTNGKVGVGMTPMAALDANGTVRASGVNTPTTGAGLEMFYQSNQSNLISFDRAASLYKPLLIDGATTYINVNSGGPVGIGLPPGTTPSTKLDVNGSLTVRSTEAVQGNSFSVGGSTLVVSAGNIGVGTSSPQTTLDVSGNAQFGQGVNKSTFSTSGALTLASGSSLNVSGSNGNIIGQSSFTTSGGFFGNASGLTGISGATESVNASMLGVGTAANPLGVNSSSVAVLSAGLVLNSELDSSSVTLQGNTFNGASQLVKLDANAAAQLSGSITATTETLTGNTFSVGGASFTVSGGTATVAYRLTAGSFLGVSGATESVNASMLGVGTAANPLGVNSSSVAVLSSGLVLNSELDSSSVTLQGNAFNGANQLVKLDASAAAQLTGSITATTATFTGNAFSVGVSTLVATSGSVGIRTSSPQANLDVNGNAQFGSGATKSTFTTTGALNLASNAALTLSGASGNLTSVASVTANSFFGDGSHITGVSGALSGGVANVVPVWTGATSLGTGNAFITNYSTGIGISTTATIQQLVVNGGGNNLSISASTGIAMSSGVLQLNNNTLCIGGSCFKTFLATVPAVTTYTSGSGTYTTPTSPAPLYLRVRMVGGGGGSSGSGTGGAGNGTAGGSSTFGGGTASGGAGGNFTNGTAAGGTGTLGSGWAGATFTGGTGGGFGLEAASGDAAQGGVGGNSIFGGGAGEGPPNGAGNAGSTNTGGGGSGAGIQNQTSGFSGTGGGAGGGVDAMIFSPAASFSYSVGTAGSAGSAGTGGNAGGAGGSGYIIVEAFYQ